MATPATEAAVESGDRELRLLLGSTRQRRGGRPRAPQPRRVVPHAGGARRRLLPALDRRGRGDPGDQRPAAGSGRPVRRGHVTGRARQRHPRRHLPRPSRDESRRARQRRGPRRHRRGGRHAPPTEQGVEQHRTHLPRRPRCGRDDRRHGRHARLRHHRRALRHHAGERAGLDRRARRRIDRSRPEPARENRRPATTSRACSSDRRARSASSPK